MYATGNKKMLIMLILEVLKKYSDENHPLTQQEIIRLLKRDYDMECDRRSVKANVLSLVEMGYEISMEDGYYLMNREFEDAELRMLIDSVLFSKTLSGSQAKALIGKLESFGNIYFESKVSHVRTTPNMVRTDNKHVLYNVNAINDAIEQKRKISFRYHYYGIDYKLHDRGYAYIVNPYQMVAANGHYYLLGNYDKYDDVSYYRIDRITDVEILEEKVKPMESVQGLEKGLDLPSHMAEHIYMFAGESVRVKLLTTKEMMGELVDWFGKDFRVRKTETEGQIEVVVKCNQNAMLYWAMQYGKYVEVLEPEGLRKEIADAVTEMARKYSK